MKLGDIKGIGPSTVEDLELVGVTSVKELAMSDPSDLSDVRGGADLIERAREFVPAQEPEPAKQHNAYQPQDQEEPEPEYVEVTFKGMPNHPGVKYLTVQGSDREYTLNKGIPVRLPKVDADLITSRPQYEFDVKEV